MYFEICSRKMNNFCAFLIYFPSKSLDTRKSREVVFQQLQRELAIRSYRRHKQQHYFLFIHSFFLHSSHIMSGVSGLPFYAFLRRNFTVFLRLQIDFPSYLRQSRCGLSASCMQLFLLRSPVSTVCRDEKATFETGNLTSTS